jgi:hypothetical protein
MPKGKKHTPEQIVAILRRVEQGEAAEAARNEGMASRRASNGGKPAMPPPRAVATLRNALPARRKPHPRGTRRPLLG